MKPKQLIFWIALVCLLQFVVHTAANAQAKIAVVDLDVIVQQSPEFKDVEAKLLNVKKKGEDSLAALERDFKAKSEQYQKQSALMTPEARQAEEVKLAGIRDSYVKLQQDWFSQTGVYAQFQKQLLQPIREKVQVAIEKVAKDEKAGAIFEKSVLAFYDKKLDITFKVLDYLRRDAK